MLAAADRVWWAHTIRGADIVDQDLVSAQLGRSVTVRQAVRAYVRGAFRTGLALNPLFAERLVSRQLPDADRVPAMYAYLVADQARIETALAWDAPAHAQADPSALHGRGGVLGSAWRALRDGGTVRLRGGGSADLTQLHAAIRSPETLPVTPAVPPRTLLIWKLDDADADGEGLRSALAVLGNDVADEHCELVLDIAAAPREVAMLVGPLPLGEPRISILGPRGVEERAATPETVVVHRAPGAAITAEAIRSLIDAARLGPVAPLWIGPDGAIASAGVIEQGDKTYRALRGFPREDAAAAGRELSVAVLDSPVRAAIAGDERPPRTLLGLVAVGDTPSEASTSSTPRNAALSSSQVAPRGLRRVGWTCAENGDTAPRYAAAGEVWALSDGRTVPRLRWAIKTAAPAGPCGESWGETHFARSLAAALERLGQYVAVDARPALNRSSSSLDDVVLSLRGPHPLPAPDAAHRLLWVISHPDEVTVTEAGGYDRVFAGSTTWARAASARFGMPIEPLLQCTDAHRFRSSGQKRGDDLVFVGTARGIARPAVVVPLRAGRRVRVYGPDWRGYIPGSAIVATHVPNDELPALYEAAGAVLNDHWPAMRHEGFISNRLYDVVASGGRAISDDVAGVEEIFGGAVRMFRDAEELLELTETPLDRRFPSEPELAVIAERIRREHSFDSRARTLLDAILRDG